MGAVALFFSIHAFPTISEPGTGYQHEGMATKVECFSLHAF